MRQSRKIIRRYTSRWRVRYKILCRKRGARGRFAGAAALCCYNNIKQSTNSFGRKVYYIMYTIKLLSLLFVCRRRGQYLHTSSWLQGGVKYDSLVPTGRRVRLPKCRSVLRPPPTTTQAQPPSPYDLSPRKSPAFSCRRHCRRSHEPHGGRDARACARRDCWRT